MWCCGALFVPVKNVWTVLKNSTLEGDSPVRYFALGFRDFQSSVNWKFGMNVGDIYLQT